MIKSFTMFLFLILSMHYSVAQNITFEFVEGKLVEIDMHKVNDAENMKKVVAGAIEYFSRANENLGGLGLIEQIMAINHPLLSSCVKNVLKAGRIKTKHAATAYCICNERKKYSRTGEMYQKPSPGSTEKLSLAGTCDTHYLNSFQSISKKYCINPEALAELSKAEGEVKEDDESCLWDELMDPDTDKCEKICPEGYSFFGDSSSLSEREVPGLEIVERSVGIPERQYIWKASYYCLPCGGIGSDRYIDNFGYCREKFTNCVVGKEFWNSDLEMCQEPCPNVYQERHKSGRCIDKDRKKACDMRMKQVATSLDQTEGRVNKFLDRKLFNLESQEPFDEFQLNIAISFKSGNFRFSETFEFFPGNCDAGAIRQALIENRSKVEENIKQIYQKCLKWAEKSIHSVSHVNPIEKYLFDIEKRDLVPFKPLEEVDKILKKSCDGGFCGHGSLQGIQNGKCLDKCFCNNINREQDELHLYGQKWNGCSYDRILRFGASNFYDESFQYYYDSDGSAPYCNYGDAPQCESDYPRIGHEIMSVSQRKSLLYQYGICDPYSPH